jgi:hypothetical protein
MKYNDYVRVAPYGDWISDIIGTVTSIIAPKPPPPPPPPQSFWSSGLGIGVMAAGGVLVVGGLLLVATRRPKQKMNGYRRRKHRR